MQIAFSKTGGARKRSHRIGRDDVGPIINVSQIQAGATSVVYMGRTIYKEYRPAKGEKFANHM